nr:immunoglobulin heavy chain junction region [Macaca mulatta]MOV87798.1 immunoglobulin heavy chain junction region [Macaca mulatta]MOV88196.1 immunoglobulin heavy chain junction region [Macaca mulatta]MOV88256.1 immunoglobulin heavy chain junction region [Macaca mulatta]MOV88655.1 immunoglobulin heavy chain junction region [Macaca mulatta]
CARDLRLTIATMYFDSW